MNLQDQIIINLKVISILKQISKPNFDTVTFQVELDSALFPTKEITEITVDCKKEFFKLDATYSFGSTDAK